MALTLFGIPNCDTVKKARTWLEQNAIPYTFHDYKKQGIDAGHLQRWQKAAGTAVILNQRGTTWKKLPDEDKSSLSEDRAIQLMQAHPSLIKRPVVEGGKALLVGFNVAEWQHTLLP